MNINIQLDLNQPISLLQDYARGLALKNAIHNHTVIRNL